MCKEGFSRNTRNEEIQSLLTQKCSFERFVISHLHISLRIHLILPHFNIRKEQEKAQSVSKRPYERDDVEFDSQVHVLSYPCSVRTLMGREG